MKRRKSVVEHERVLWQSDRVGIYEFAGGGYMYEVDGEVTIDPAEAVAMMMHLRVDGPWHLEVGGSRVDSVPERCLYWLSGGDTEWVLLEHYRLPWPACYPDFCERWGAQVAAVAESSRTLGDIREGFRSRLGLVLLYDWCVSAGLVR